MSYYKEKIINDAKSVGLSIKPGCEKGTRGHLEFVNLAKKNPITRLKIHPPDKRTPYHIHIYDKCGNSLDSNLNIVDRSSAAAHIKYRGEK